MEVVVPQAQTCCGALSWHVGNLSRAQAFASAILSAFPEDTDAIITNAAGCGSGMHEYHMILKGSEHEEAAERFRHRVVDVSQFLDSLGELKEIPDPGGPIRIAYHDACHLANAQGVRSQPRTLLNGIPGVTLQEIAAGHLCCGSAGTYNIDQPETARSLGQQKVANILATDPDLVATGNIGCLTQLATHLAGTSSRVPVRHTLQIIRDAYAGNLIPPNRPT